MRHDCTKVCERLVYLQFSYHNFAVVVVVVVVTRPFTMDGGTAGEHAAPEAEHSPGPRLEIVEKIRQRACSAKSPYMDNAECDERCSGSDDRRRCIKDSSFCQS